MKKLIAILLIALLLSGCTGEPAPEQMITRPPQESRNDAPEADSQPQATQGGTPQPLGNYTFLTGGVELIPGAPFDPTVLPEPESVYEVPSCAIEGTDNLYNYGGYELTAFDDGKQELIYSILLTDPSVTTTEGLALGDSRQRMTELYGEAYTAQGAACTYTGDRELLIIILQNDTVASIEYRMIVE